MSSKLVAPASHRLLAAMSRVRRVRVTACGPTPTVVDSYCSVVGSALPSSFTSSSASASSSSASASSASASSSMSYSQKRGLILPRNSMSFKVNGWKPDLHLGGGSCSCGFCKSSFSTSSKDSKDSKDKKESEKNDVEEQNKLLQEEVRLLKSKLLSFDPHVLEMDELNSKPDPDLDFILENNRKWVKRRSEEDPNFFQNIGGPQHPKYLYVGCSDSRVPANEILGLGPGQVFVHRNVGNQINGNDLNVLSVLEFGVMHLLVKHIIVTGHYDCGAVKAATQKQDLGLLENWLRSIRDVHRIHQTELANIVGEEEKHKRLVELNVMEQGKYRLQA